jgi:predicted GIY-YIG superfamily endonuclease
MNMSLYWVHLPNSNIKTDGYVGISSDVKQRWRKHRTASSGSIHFRNAIIKYEKDLIWEVVFTGTEEGCLQLEEYFRPKENIGWNMKPGGKFVKLPYESIQKMRKSLTGKKHSQETKDNRRIAMLTANNPQVKLINVYDGVTGECLAENIRTSEWIRNNPMYNHSHLQDTARADRTKPSTGKTDYFIKEYTLYIKILV